MTRFALIVIALGLSFIAYDAYASPRAAAALERIEGMREGTRALNLIMGVNTRRVPWCGYAVRYAMLRAGKRPAKHFASARAWLKWGRAVARSSIRRGDVVLFRSRHAKSGYHVAIVSRVQGNRIRTCSGNAKNRVLCRWRAKASVAGARR